MLEYIKHCLISVITPSSWFSEKSDKETDTLVKNVIDNGEYINHDEYTIKFKYKNRVIELWIGNYPYSYGFVYRDSLFILDRKLPFIQTRNKLRSFVKTK